jgi:hypothetical protein
LAGASSSESESEDVEESSEEASLVAADDSTAFLADAGGPFFGASLSLELDESDESSLLDEALPIKFLISSSEELSLLSLELICATRTGAEWLVYKRGSLVNKIIRNG